MRDRLFADMSWIEGVREYVMRYIDDDLKAVRQGNRGVSAKLRRWGRILLDRDGGWLFLVGHIGQSQEANPEGLYVHQTVPAGEFRGDGGGDVAGLELQVPLHQGNRGVMAAAAARMEEASALLLQEQNWSSGVDWDASDIWLSFA